MEFYKLFKCANSVYQEKNLKDSNISTVRFKVFNFLIVWFITSIRMYFPSEKKWSRWVSKPLASSFRPTYLSVLQVVDSYGLCQMVPQSLAPNLFENKTKYTVSIRKFLNYYFISDSYSLLVVSSHFLLCWIIFSMLAKSPWTRVPIFMSKMQGWKYCELRSSKTMYWGEGRTSLFGLQTKFSF